MKYLINFHKPKCKSPLGLSRPILFAEFKEKKCVIFMVSWNPFLYILRRLLLLYGPCVKGNLYSFFSPPPM